MKRQLHRFAVIAVCLLLAAPSFAQGTQADYERANALREKYSGLAVNLPERANWIGQTSRFWYRKSVKGGSEFVLVDAETMAKRPAFDHAKIAASLSAATGEKYEALKLPFQSINFVDNESAIDVTVTAPEHADAVPRLGAATRGALVMLGEWFGPLPSSSLTVVGTPWRDGSADAAAGRVAVPLRWIAPARGSDHAADANGA